MTSADILETLRVQPFEPFRICMTDGKFYDIHHSELCMPGKRHVIVGIVTDANDPLFDRTIKVDPLHIISLEPLPANAPKSGTSGNGNGTSP